MDVMNLGPEDWVTCPYDPLHRMKYSKFHNHFVKCRKEHPDDHRKQCPYNASELIEVEDFENHLIDCPYQSLYFNVGQVQNNLPAYDAPSHFIVDQSKTSLRSKSRFEINDESEDEFDSVSVISKRRARLFPQIEVQDEEKFQKPEVTELSSYFANMHVSQAKRGFGRGAWIKQMLEKQNTLNKNLMCNTDEKIIKIRENVSSYSVKPEKPDKIPALIQQFREDPFSINKRFGRGRGAIFRSLLQE